VADDVTPIRADLPVPRTRAEHTRASPVSRAKRRNRVLELRAAGLTEDQIASQVGITQQGVNQIIARALENMANDSAERVEQIRAMKLFELDQLKRAIWADALKGNLKAVREAVKIIQVQAKISGAEAPVKVEQRVVHDMGVDHAEIERLEAAWLASDIPDAEVVDGDEG
jgi:transcriptional regulator